MSDANYEEIFNELEECTEQVKRYKKMLDDPEALITWAEEKLGLSFHPKFGTLRLNGVGTNIPTVCSVLYSGISSERGELEEKKNELLLKHSVFKEDKRYKALRSTRLKNIAESHIKAFLVTAQAIMRKNHVQNIQKSMDYNPDCVAYTESVLYELMGLTAFQAKCFKEKLKDVKLQLNDFLGDVSPKSQLPIYLWIWSRGGGTFKTSLMDKLFGHLDFMANNGAKPEELSDGGKNRNFTDIEQYLVQVFNDPNDGAGSITSNTFKALVDPEASGRPMGTNGTIKVYNRSLYIFTANLPREEYQAFSDDGDLRRCLSIEAKFNIKNFSQINALDPIQFFKGIDETRSYMTFAKFRAEYTDTRSHLIRKGSVDSFLDEAEIIPVGDKLEGVTTQLIYNEYKRFCQDNGYKPKNKSNFVIDLKVHGLQEMPLIEGLKKVKGFYINDHSYIVDRQKIKVARIGG